MAQNMDQRIDFFSRLAATERSNEIPESAKDAVARHVTVPQRQGSAVTSLRLLRNRLSGTAELIRLYNAPRASNAWRATLAADSSVAPSAA
jgi:hypothetical protein